MIHRYVAIIAESHRHARAASEAMMHGLVVHQNVEVNDNRESYFRVIDHEAGLTTWLVSIPMLSAHSALEGTRFDEIVIAGDYLHWDLPTGLLTYLWHVIQANISKRRAGEARVTFL